MIENSIRAKAMQATALTALIGNKFHLTTKHNSNDCYVLLRVINDSTPTELHLEDNQSEANIQFDCYAKTPQQAKAIAKEVNNLFHKKGYQDSDLVIQLALKQNRLPDFDTDSKLYRESLDYIFYYNEV